MTDSMNRRTLMKSALAAAAALGSTGALAPLFGADGAPRVKLRKAVKFGMIGIKGSIEEKFNLIKKLGFEGVELDSPSNVNKQEAVEASKKTGIVIHGVVDSTHWNIRHSDPKPEIRAKALEDLLGALKDAKLYGGTTVLLVPGKVADEKNENFDQVWERSTEQVKKAIPTAKELGIKIAIEVVWNNFLTT